MADNATTEPCPPVDVSDVPVFASTDPLERTAEVASLLQSLDEAAAQSGRSATKLLTDANETKLVQARLGIASGFVSSMP